MIKLSYLFHPDTLFPEYLKPQEGHIKTGKWETVKFLSSLAVLAFLSQGLVGCLLLVLSYIFSC